MQGIKLRDLILENLKVKLTPSDENITAQVNELYINAKTMPVEELIRETKNLIKELFKDIENIDKLFFRIALKLEKAGEKEDAIFFYRLSNLLCPNPKAVNNLAVLYSETGRKEQAIKLLKEAIKLFPDNEILKANLKKLNQ
ncbi:tetratricopeptide repeat protein [Thermodesulfovibrio hydrogeniphilus]